MEDLVAAPLAGLTLASADADIVISEWIEPPGPSSAERPIAPLHLHHRDDEAWYVIQGRLGLTLGDETVELGPGGAALAPRGTRHTFWNASDGATRYLIVMTWNIKRLIDELHGTRFADPPATFAKYDSELVA